jgi:hypothetical protein
MWIIKPVIGLSREERICDLVPRHGDDIDLLSQSAWRNIAQLGTAGVRCGSETSFGLFAHRLIPSLVIKRTPTGSSVRNQLAFVIDHEPGAQLFDIIQPRPGV